MPQIPATYAELLAALTALRKQRQQLETRQAAIEEQLAGMRAEPSSLPGLPLANRPDWPAIILYPLQKMSMGVRLERALARQSPPVRLIGDVCFRYTKRTFLSVPHLGNKSLEELEEQLVQCNLRLGERPAFWPSAANGVGRQPAAWPPANAEELRQQLKDEDLYVPDTLIAPSEDGSWRIERRG